MLPPVKPNLVIFDYHGTLLDSLGAIYDDEAAFYFEALDFVRDLKEAGVICALVSLGVDARSAFDKLQKSSDLFQYHRFPMAFGDLDEAKQRSFAEIVRDVEAKIGCAAVVWFIGDKTRDFSHSGKPNHYNIAASEDCEAFDSYPRGFSIIDYSHTREVFASLLASVRDVAGPKLDEMA